MRKGKNGARYWPHSFMVKGCAIINFMANYCIRLACVVDLPSIVQIHIEGWQTAYAQFIPQAFIDRLSVEEDRREMQAWFTGSAPPLGLVAEQAGEVIGFVLMGPNEGDPPEYDAEVYKLFVRPAFQNQGIGKALLANAARLLREKGFRSTVIWAYAEGSSASFYEHLGGKVVFKTNQKPGGRETPILVFGWELDSLTTRLCVE